MKSDSLVWNISRLLIPQPLLLQAKGGRCLLYMYKCSNCNWSLSPGFSQSNSNVSTSRATILDQMQDCGDGSYCEIPNKI